jgi:Leucine-rich repeat (LRR) protein
MSCRESIGQMANLKELYVHNNRLREFPDVSNLKNLRYLLLQHNHLTEFPYSVLKLTQLEELNLSSNLITEFPEEIRNFDSLTFIYLDDNQTDLHTMAYEKFKMALKDLNDRGVRIRFDYPGSEQP